MLSLVQLAEAVGAGTGSLAAMADREEMDQRLRARPTLAEWSALILLASILSIFLVIYQRVGYVPFDYWVYIRATEGDFTNFYYSYWVLPLMSPLSQLSIPVGYWIWGLINSLAVLFAARVFGGRSVLALLSFQMMFVLAVGQITGLLVLGLALVWWGLAHRNWLVAGLGLVLAAVKIHIGMIFCVFLVGLAPARVQDKLRTLLVPAVVALFSLVVWPGWPADVLENIQANPPIEWGSISLWRWIGPWALVLFLFPLLTDMQAHRRLIALGAAAALAMPYFQQADLLVLFVLPVGWLPLILGNLGYFFFYRYWAAIQMLFVVPLVLYVSMVMAELPGLFRHRLPGRQPIQAITGAFRGAPKMQE